MKKLNNKYFLLRHGRNIHQTTKKHICYGWPDDSPPCMLDDAGLEQAKLIKLDNKIDLIFSSDIFRVKQTVEIAFPGKEIIFDKRLRDINWGIFAGKEKEKALAFYNDKDRLKDAPPKGESWGDIQKRVLEFLFDIENKYDSKNIIIASHGDPILLIEAWYHDWKTTDEIMSHRDNMINTGEVRQLN